MLLVSYCRVRRSYRQQSWRDAVPLLKERLLLLQQYKDNVSVTRSKLPIPPREYKKVISRDVWLLTTPILVRGRRGNHGILI
jgi:hypothetical protein